MACYTFAAVKTSRRSLFGLLAAPLLAPLLKLLPRPSEAAAPVAEPEFGTLTLEGRQAPKGYNLYEGIAVESMKLWSDGRAQFEFDEESRRAADALAKKIDEDLMKIWTSNDPTLGTSGLPPQHWNCRSTVAPLVYGDAMNVESVEVGPGRYLFAANPAKVERVMENGRELPAEDWSADGGEVTVRPRVPEYGRLTADVKGEPPPLSAFGFCVVPNESVPKGDALLGHVDLAGSFQAVGIIKNAT